MHALSRRICLAGGIACALTACVVGGSDSRAQKIDTRVDIALDYLHQQIPGSRELREKAAGVLVMPLITQAGFGVGASYGRGALRIDGFTAGYYSAASASLGLQIGAQQYAHALFFMTQEALADFANAQGWAAGADIKYAVSANAGVLNANTITVMDPVVGIVFGQAGLIAGATLEGTKYTPIAP